jgi:DNA-binding NarL/FixJ family response regulator
MALRNVLWDMFNGVEIYSYTSMDAFIRDSNRHFVHFFVDSDILFSEAEEFEMLKSQTTVLSKGGNRAYEDSGFKVLDLTRPEHELMQDLRRILNTGLYGEVREIGKDTRGITERLSAREKEVLTLMVKGFINKEIASELGISLPTVIFHRNNICLKLKTRSIGKMTVYAVLAGIVEINEI